VTAAFRRLVLVIGALVLLVLVHFSSILLLPQLAPTDVWTRLGRFETELGLQVLPPPTAEQSAIRLADPATVLALCRYDLDEVDGVLVSGQPNLAYWGLSVHNRTGAGFYAMNNRAAGERPLELRVTTPDEVERLRAEAPEDAEQTLLVAAAEPRGFVLIRALVPEPTSRPLVEQEVRNFSCRPVE
jgi:uncharacterized membrane protein